MRSVVLSGLASALLVASFDARAAEHPPQRRAVDGPPTTGVTAATSGGAAKASPTVATKEAAAIDAARSWLKLVDAGRYSESWSAAAPYFRNAIPQDQWARQAAAVRGPLGKVLKREVKAQKYTTTVPGAPDGEYVVIQYVTSFANKKSAIETITPTLGADGTWHVTGYFVR